MIFFKPKFESDLSIIITNWIGHHMETQLKNTEFLRQLAIYSRKLAGQPNSISDWVQLPAKIKKLKEFLKDNTLAVIIALHAYDGLEPFLIFAINELLEKNSYFKLKFSEAERKNLITILTSILNLVFNASYQFFLAKQGKNYIDLFKQCNKLIQPDVAPHESSLRMLLDKLNDIDSVSEAQQKRKRLNQFIIGHLMVEKAQGPLQEVALNWIKREAQRMQHQKDELVCCRLTFQHKSTSVLGKFSESANQEFKDYRWPLQNQSIKFHLTKTVVGYLNTTGGIIYVGLREDKSKIIEVKGIKLSAKQKIDFLYFLHNDIMRGVYPKEPDQKKYEQDLIKDPTKASDYKRRLEEQFESTQNRKSEYRINKYVHVDFLDIYDKDTLLNSKEEDCGLYIARIKIKIGDNRELYHVINPEKQIPEAYFREATSVKKKSLKEFTDLFYERMKNTNNFGNEKVQQHPNCRFNARCNE